MLGGVSSKSFAVLMQHDADEAPHPGSAAITFEAVSRSTPSSLSRFLTTSVISRLLPASVVVVKLVPACISYTMLRACLEPSGLFE